MFSRDLLYYINFPRMWRDWLMIRFADFFEENPKMKSPDIMRLTVIFGIFGFLLGTLMYWIIPKQVGWLALLLYAYLSYIDYQQGKRSGSKRFSYITENAMIPLALFTMLTIVALLFFPWIAQVGLP